MQTELFVSRVLESGSENVSVSSISTEAIEPLLELNILTMTKVEPICIEEILKNINITSHFRQVMGNSTLNLTKCLT